MDVAENDFLVGEEPAHKAVDLGVPGEDPRPGFDLLRPVWMEADDRGTRPLEGQGPECRTLPWQVEPAVVISDAVTPVQDKLRSDPLAIEPPTCVRPSLGIDGRWGSNWCRPVKGCHNGGVIRARGNGFVP